MHERQSRGQRTAGDKEAQKMVQHQKRCRREPRPNPLVVTPSRPLLSPPLPRTPPLQGAAAAAALLSSSAASTFSAALLLDLDRLVAGQGSTPAAESEELGDHAMRDSRARAREYEAAADEEVAPAAPAASAPAPARASPRAAA